MLNTLKLMPGEYQPEVESTQLSLIPSPGRSAAERRSSSMGGGCLCPCFFHVYANNDSLECFLLSAYLSIFGEMR